MSDSLASQPTTVPSGPAPNPPERRAADVSDPLPDVLEVRGLSSRQIRSRPLDYLPAWQIRIACRYLMFPGRRWILSVRNPDRLLAPNDPYILVMNHNQRPEALLVPVFAAWLRRGRLVNFVADWQFLMVPVIGSLFRMGDSIIVGRKNARPRFLNVLKRMLVDPTPVFEQMLERVRLGFPLAIFPEAKMNRDPERMRKGQTGAARVSIATGAPLLPAGIRFPGHTPGTPIQDREPFEIEIGDPVFPDPGATIRDSEAVNALHRRMMEQISLLCGKRWDF
jgi:1-acyl-sn-glycerol-3-phosphate acyltransferase